MGAAPHRRPPAGEAPLLFLNNYRGGGIGDFGSGVFSALRACSPGIVYEETPADGVGWWPQLRRVRRFEGGCLSNVGLTAWGTSGLRNYAGFDVLGRRRRVGLPLVALVHHTIEMFTAEETGYPISRLRRWGAHSALRRIAQADLVAFSPRVAQLLGTEYHARSVWLTPMPSGPARAVPPGSDENWKVSAVGYLAPYKGVDRFLDVAASLGPAARFQLIGRPHPVLGRQPRFSGQVDAWRRRAAGLGVAVPGYLSPDELDRALGGRSIGLLPYTSASGASASFGLFAERGVPVVSSDLPEFQFLAERGAGVLPVSAEPRSLAAAVRSLMDSPARYASLVGLQRSFAATHTFEAFARSLLDRFPSLAGAG